jgi:chromosome segregation ATPase
MSEEGAMLTQQDYARLRSLGQFDTLEAQYFALRARNETDQLCIKAQADELGRLRARLEAVERLVEKLISAGEITANALAEVEKREQGYLSELADYATTVTNLRMRVKAVDAEHDQLIKDRQSLIDNYESLDKVQLQQQLAASQERMRELEHELYGLRSYQEASMNVYMNALGFGNEYDRKCSTVVLGIKNLTTRLATVEAALKHLVNEVEGCTVFHLADLIGNTNLSCLVKRLREAQHALTPPREAGR